MNEVHEMKTLTLAGEEFNSFQDQQAREDLLKKLPKPEIKAKVGQYLRVLSVDEDGKITGIEPVDISFDSDGDVDLTGYATEQWVKDGYQPKGNYLTEHQSLEGYAKTEDVPKKPEDIGALPDTYTPPNQTAEQVGADPKGTAVAAVSQHNTADDSHNDIRLELKALSDRLNAFFDSDDQTLDELSEIVTYITSNKSLIDAITTSKVNVTDIINNLTTNVSNKPLSAAQGVVLKGLIDTLSGNLANYQPKGDYLEESALPTAIDTALAQAKASGEFDGAPGAKGDKGEQGPQGIQGPAYTLTETDKNTIAAAVKASLVTENWTFTLEDGSPVTKAVYVG